MGWGTRLSKRQKIALVVVLAGVAITGLMLWRAAMQSRESIHIVYKSVWSRPALPKGYVDGQIAGVHERLVRQIGANKPHTVEINENLSKRSWQSRYKPQAEVGQADYWGTSTEMVWVYDQFGHSFFASYNGKYVAQGQPGIYGLRPRRKDEGIGYLLVSDLGRGRLQEAVPYLGFAQPGLPFYEAKRHLIKNASGWEEHAREGLEYVFRYDHLHRPVSLELRLGPVVIEKYEFSNCVRFRGIDYPKRVVHTKYGFGALPDSRNMINLAKLKEVRMFIEEVTTYDAISIDNKSLREAGFDVERPPKGTQIQDLRPEFTNDPGRGLSYAYSNTKRTVTETSAMKAKEKR